MTASTRQPRGIPTGGQFAAGSRSAPDVALSDQPPPEAQANPSWAQPSDLAEHDRLDAMRQAARDSARDMPAALALAAANAERMSTSDDPGVGRRYHQIAGAAEAEMMTTPLGQEYRAEMDRRQSEYEREKPAAPVTPRRYGGHWGAIRPAGEDPAAVLARMPTRNLPIKRRFIEAGPQNAWSRTMLADIDAEIARRATLEPTQNTAAAS